jgi:hypothetical protein
MGKILASWDKVKGFVFQGITQYDIELTWSIGA